MNAKVNAPATVGPKELWLLADSECKTGALPGYNYGFYSVLAKAEPAIIFKNYAPCECRRGSAKA